VFVLLIAKKIIEAENLCIGDQVEITLSIREPHAGGAGFTNEQTEHDDIC
jgi:hypothetical protein